MSKNLVHPEKSLHFLVNNPDLSLSIHMFCLGLANALNKVPRFVVKRGTYQRIIRIEPCGSGKTLGAGGLKNLPFLLIALPDSNGQRHSDSVPSKLRTAGWQNGF